VNLSRLQDSLDAAARALAPSKEALDAPLGPPGLPDELGPATGRSDAYPDGTSTRWSDPTCRTHHRHRLDLIGATIGAVVRIRRDSQIHDTDGGWFRARWHFSFDTYRDPENDGFGAMRVFNDDRLVPGAIWPLHPHRDVEGLTYVVEGLFGHEDNVGGPFGPLPAGSVQRMTLGSGALHSERNASPTEPMRFIQIWILPDSADLPPAVEQRVFTTADRTNRLLKVIGPEGGLSAEEAEDAERAGFKKVSFGPRILRAETAAIAVISVVQHALGDLY